MVELRGKFFHEVFSQVSCLGLHLSHLFPESGIGRLQFFHLFKEIPVSSSALGTRDLGGYVVFLPADLILFVSHSLFCLLGCDGAFLGGLFQVAKTGFTFSRVRELCRFGGRVRVVVKYGKLGR